MLSNLEHSDSSVVILAEVRIVIVARDKIPIQ